METASVSSAIPRAALWRVPTDSASSLPLNGSMQPALYILAPFIITAPSCMGDPGVKGMRNASVPVLGAPFDYRRGQVISLQGSENLDADTVYRG